MFKCCPFSNRKKTCSVNTAARVVDGKLILSFPAAQTPIVWQVDLHEIKASSFEINHDDDPNAYTLTMIKSAATKAATKRTKIATFLTQQDATQALMDTADALTHAHGHDAASNIPTSPNAHAYVQENVQYGAVKKPPSTLKTVIFTILTLIVLFFLVTYLFARGTSSYDQTQMGQSGVNGAINNAPAAAGVPLSADDFLRGQ